MKVTQLDIINVRSFKGETIRFSDGINIIVGPNNSGKTTILKSILLLQTAGSINATDQRKFTENGSIKIHLNENNTRYFSDESKKIDSIQTISLATSTLQAQYKPNANGAITNSKLGPLQGIEPNNYIYPFLSKRKVTSFQEQINLAHSNSVTGNFQNLYPKIDRISDPQFLPAYTEYIEACDEILGFRVTTVASEDGKKGAYIVKNMDNISIDSMGEGVANMLALIVDLCMAEDKLFLIEEPENDIHPKALKSLLNLIARKSTQNQFIITTHSNIVTKHLGSQNNSKIISVKMEFEDRVPTSSTEVIESSDDRKRILEDLGYELYDFDLWGGWLFLEEASAERIIRDILIPLLYPELQTKLRTYSARSITEIESKFSDFNSLFVFLHLEPSYKNKVWVVIDEGDNEKKIIDRMKESYSKRGWSQECFRQFQEHDFERYYPAHFKGRVDEILALDGKAEKREKKKQLLKDVILWCNEDEERAKIEFRESAAEVIEILGSISKELI